MDRETWDKLGPSEEDSIHQCQVASPNWQGVLHKCLSLCNKNCCALARHPSRPTVIYKNRLWLGWHPTPLAIMPPPPPPRALPHAHIALHIDSIFPSLISNPLNPTRPRRPFCSLSSHLLSIIYPSPSLYLLRLNLTRPPARPARQALRCAPWARNDISAVVAWWKWTCCVIHNTILCVPNKVSSFLSYKLQQLSIQHRRPGAFIL